jgi:alkylated DNA repair dioxygenase AlkB
MEQLNIFGLKQDLDMNSQLTQGKNIIQNGEFLFYPFFFNEEECNSYLLRLRNNILWKQESMSIYGKQINFPRLTSWYGDQERSYRFSGITLQPSAWIKELIEIKQKIEPIAEVSFNSVLLNLYRNGNDSISWHTDAEKELGINPIIGSVNFGETRTFQLRHIKTKQKIEIELNNGSLLIMKGELQHYWQHQIPKTNKIIGERINLTFRLIK